MSKVQNIEDIFTSLNTWREERGLQNTVGNIAANIGEEIVEYLRAENDEQRVDALCDLFVFSVNALYASDHDKYNYFISSYYIKMSYRLDRNWFFDIVECFSSLCRDEVIIAQNIGILGHISQYSIFQIEKLGFDFLIAMDETLKEIHSRTGAWNNNTRKWEKFKTEEAKALWYKADYSKAKL